ncbi:MAG: NAD(P)/FAD-dependent oxidoreductase [Patescibacteria group bacterium]
MDKGQKKKIVILGGGFGGLYTYLSLKKQFKKDEIDITIVNRTNYFLFTPLLHEVATGSIAHHQVVESIRQIIYKGNATLHVAELMSVDCERKIVTTSIAEIPYDILVVALGATTNFFNAPGAQENCFVLKDLHDAIALRTAFIEAFEKASEIKDPQARKKVLSFAIVGGGATGVELVSETADLFLNTFSKYYRGLIKTSDITLSIINRDPELLNVFHPRLRKNALRVLRHNGVNVILNTGVKEVKKNGIVLADDSLLEANLVVWTAGVKPNVPAFAHPVAQDPSGRIVVNSSLQILECPNVFVIGDMASLAGKNGKALPMLAQVAVRQGTHTGKNIKRLLEGQELMPFVYRSQGELASLGQWHAVANIGGIRFSGAFAWFLWRTIYLFKFLSGSKKIKIAVDWTVNLFYPRDITKA